MADQVIDVQLKISGGVKSPVYTGDRRLTLTALARLIGAMNHGSLLGAGSNYLQVQTGAVAATGTVTAAAVQSGDTVSIGGQALTAAQRRATGTVTPGTGGNVPVEGDTVTINGQVFTAVNGAVVLGEPTFDVSGNATAVCTSLAAQVNAYGGALVSGIVAGRSSAGVFTAYAVNQGTSGNSITLATSNNTRLAKSGTTLANGSAIANNTFDMAGTNATTAAAIAAAVAASTTAAVKQFTAAAASAVCTFTSKVAGVAGNTLALASSDGTRLAVSAATLTGGTASAVTRWTL